jgi:uncharacterized protein (TIGR02145 family)
VGTGGIYIYTPTAGDQISCTMTSNASCVTGSPATSNTVTMAINPLLPAGVTIAASANPVTPGTPVTFTATPANGGAAPSYQWKVNGMNAGSNAPTYTYIPAHGDAVTCVMTSNAPCVTGSPAASNAVTMMVNQLLPVSVLIEASANPVYPGMYVMFTARPTNGGAAPSFQWKVNGVNAGTNSAAYRYSPVNNDAVTCVLTSSLDPLTISGNPAVSNVITMTTSTGVPAPCTSTPIVTHGGQTYNTVQIGTQCWLRENMNIGTQISATVSQTNNTAIEKYCYDNDPVNCNIYGGLYQWAEGVQYLNNATSTANWNPVPTGHVQGICPAGWHIPTMSERAALETFLGGFLVAGGMMKETGTTHWATPNTGASNTSGFTSLPNGIASYQGGFLNLGVNGHMWTVSAGQNPNTDVYYFGCTYIAGAMAGGQAYKTSGNAVRCLQDGPVGSATLTASAYAVMPGTPVTYTATPVNGGAVPSYQWKVNGVNVGVNAQTYTYTPVNNDNVTCEVASSLPNVTNSPFTSNAVNMIVYTTGTACAGTPTVTYGGQTYNTVQIGSQCWLRENLNIGTQINATSSQTKTSPEVIQKYCYNNDAAQCNIYGGLYQWAEAVQYLNNATNTTNWNPVPTGNVQGVCPAGWHIPTNAEQTAMQTFLGGSTVAGGKLKEMGLLHWGGPNGLSNVGATNETGFTMLAGGFVLNGVFGNLHSYADIWTTTKGALNSAAFYYGATFAASNTIGGEVTKITGNSVRCLKD